MKKIIGIFVCMLLIATAIPAVGTIENDNPTIRETYDDYNNLIKQVIESGVLSNNDWLEEDKLLASDGAASDWFGSDVSIDGDSAIIGATSNDDNGPWSGSAYVFARTGSVWTEQAKLLASDGAADDRFGETVSIDGDSVIIGAYKDDDNGGDSGSAYVFIKESENQPPNPPTINGPTSGKVGEFYDYNFTDCIDPDGDDMTYHVEWDDGGVDDGFVASGGGFTLTHSWDTEGTFTIKAKLIDDYGAESDWAEYDVTITKKSRAINTPFLKWLQNYLNMFPILHRLLSNLF